MKKYLGMWIAMVIFTISMTIASATTDTPAGVFFTIVSCFSGLYTIFYPMSVWLNPPKPCKNCTGLVKENKRLYDALLALKP